MNRSRTLAVAVLTATLVLPAAPAHAGAPVNEPTPAILDHDPQGRTAALVAPIMHVVVDGETWDDIAARYGLGGRDPAGEMLQWNPEWAHPATPPAGVRVRVPTEGAARPALPAYDPDLRAWKVIASATSQFHYMPWAQRHNVLRGAQAINDHFSAVQIPPRGRFSVHEMLGEVSYATGWVDYEAMLVVNGTVIAVPALAGGVCQIPSTIYPAVLAAGMFTLERTVHPYYPYWWFGWAEGYGIDATIAMPGPDLVMRNPYLYPLRLRAVVDEAAETFTVQVIAPPQLKPYRVEIDGPYYEGPYGLVPAIDAGWVTWHSRAVFWQSVFSPAGEIWTDERRSYYLAAPF